MDNLDFLDGSEEPNVDVHAEETVETPEVETPEVEAQPEPAERPRDEHGRFAPKQEPKPEPIMVPLAALHETRDELKQLKAQLEQFQQPRQQPATPDPVEDPEGYAAYQNASVQQAVLNTRLDLSEEMTRTAIGDELVDQARDWGLAQFRSNPAFQAEVLRQRNPYGYLVKEYQRQTALAKIGDPAEIDAFLAWKQAQEATQQQAAPAAHSEAPLPPRSIASAPSAGGVQHQAVGPGVAFDNIFGG